MITLTALLATAPPALVETGTPLDTGESSDDDGCAVFFGLLLTIGAGLTTGHRRS